MTKQAKQYTTPRFTVYGEVAQLTQVSSTGCTNNAKTLPGGVDACRESVDHNYDYGS